MFLCLMSPGQNLTRSIPAQHFVGDIGRGNMLEGIGLDLGVGQVRKLLHASGNLLGFSAGPVPSLGAGVLQGRYFSVKLRNVAVLFLDPDHCVLIFGFQLLNPIQELLLLAYWLFVFLFVLHEPPLGGDQLFVLLQLPLLELLILSQDLPQILPQFLNLLFLFIEIRIYCLPIQQIVHMLFLFSYCFFQILYLLPELLNFSLLLFHDALEIKYPFEADLIRLFALKILNCLLQPFDHLVSILQLQGLALWSDSAYVGYTCLQLLLGCFLQLVIESGRQELQLAPQIFILFQQLNLSVVDIRLFGAFIVVVEWGPCIGLI